jgi:predicted O-linked N-acetylglucosamine transferase (SPINDLY family)
MPNLVTTNAQAYGDRVVELAGDAALTARLCAHLESQRGQSPLFKGAEFTQGLEALYERMWAHGHTGAPPVALLAQ